MNPEQLLKSHLEQVLTRRQRCRLWAKLACCWAATAFVALLVGSLERQTGWASSLILPLIVGVGFIVAVALFVRHAGRPDRRRLARQIETHFPQLDGRLLTAVQQNADAGGRLNYLQQRLVEEVLASLKQDDWAAVIPRSRVTLAQIAHWLALIICLLALWSLPQPEKPALLARIADFSISVSPGDISLERGSSLVVLARFKGAVPGAVELLTAPHPNQPVSRSATTRIPLVKSLADPIFGGSISEVTTNLIYRIDYAGKQTRDFTVTVFEYPRLERADVDLTFPDYTAQRPKRVENTRRLSAVEGSRVDLTLQFNKPVVSARLVTKDNDRAVLPLIVETNRAGASLRQFHLLASKTYELQLIDAEGRTNKASSQFVFDALKNRTPEFRLTSPRGDLRPSNLEEISFEGTVWDDFGVPAYGLAYTLPGEETRFIELEKNIAAKEKRPFSHVLRLEDLGLQPDQLVAWFVWADDVGPEGELRRTAGDLFFAEVRPFEEVFREGQDNGSGEGSQSGSQQGGQSTRLADLQKKIISATWNLQRQHGKSLPPERKAPALREVKPSKSEKGAAASGHAHQVLELTSRFQVSDEGGPARWQPSGLTRYPQFAGALANKPGSALSPAGQIDPQRPRRGGGTNAAATRNQLIPPASKTSSYQNDAQVVRDSQAQALEQAEGTASEQRDPRAQALWGAAVKEMEKALARLNNATNSAVTLPEALAAEQAAYQALLKLQEHEYQVMRNRSSRSQGGGASQSMQRQLEQMDMTQSENRYETQRQAQRPQNNQMREQLQVMNRLQELARRQQDLNDRLKELQTALQEARTEQEREEIRRRLKRLQEEEQQMLADVDELRQRMERPENQSQMADERRQLDQTREDIQRASEASSQGAASQALAAGTRAQQQLQQLRDQMRKENSNQFADDLRQMRADARELARRQEDILKKIEPEDGAANGPKPLSDAPEREQLLRQLAQQKEHMTNLIERATQVSQQAEDAEPLLSRQLYDSVRKFSQDNLKNLKETQEELISRRLMTENLYEHLKQSPEPDAAKLLDVTSDMLRHDFRRQALDAAQRTRSAVEDLNRGVERAAESVLGDDTEALRLAQQELDQLTEQLQREMAQASGTGASTNQQPATDAEGRARLSQREGGTAQQSSDDPTAKAGQQAQASGGAQSATNLASVGEQGSNPSKQATQEGNASGQRPQEQASSEQANSGSAGQQPGSQSSEQGRQAGANGNAREGERAQTGTENQASATSGQNSRQGGRRNTSGSTTGGGGGGDWGGDWLRNFNRVDNNALWQGGPLTGGYFGPWSDRLRDIEEVLEFPDLRNQVATVRERARLLRQDFKRDQKKPDWAVVRLQVMKPLLEVRARIADELARRESKDALVPIDRDPVPTRYSDLVRRYYEDLGKDKPPSLQK